MKTKEAQALLKYLETLDVEEVRVVVQLPTNTKIGDFMPALKSKGFVGLVQSSVLSDVEVLVTEARDENLRPSWA